MSTRCYLDYNASAPMIEEAYQVLIDNLSIFANPFSTHREGLQAKKILENARFIIANILNIKEHNIVFTSGASEAATTLLTPYYKIGKTTCYISKLYVGASEHPCILQGGQFAENSINIIDISPNGIIDNSNLEAQLSTHNMKEGLPLVAIQAANSETGVIQDIKSVAKIVHYYKGLLIVDVAQILGKELINLNDMDGDFYILSAHKLGGPKNIGAFITNSEIIAPFPLIKGSQEKGRRGGTQAIALCASFAKALQLRLQHLEKQNLNELRDYLEEQLFNVNEKLIIYGKTSKRLSNTSYFRFVNINSQTLQMALDLEGFAVSAGSACSSGKTNNSHVLKAMGENEEVSAIRVSLGDIHTKNDIDRFVCTIKQILNRV